MTIFYFLLALGCAGIAYYFHGKEKKHKAWQRERADEMIERIKNGEKIFTVAYKDMYRIEKLVYDSGLVRLKPCSNNSYERTFEYVGN